MSVQEIQCMPITRALCVACNVEQVESIVQQLHQLISEWFFPTRDPIVDALDLPLFQAFSSRLDDETVYIIGQYLEYLIELPSVERIEGLRLEVIRRRIVRFNELCFLVERRMSARQVFGLEEGQLTVAANELERRARALADSIDSLLPLGTMARWREELRTALDTTRSGNV